MICDKLQMAFLGMLILVLKLEQHLAEYISISVPNCKDSNYKRNQETNDARWSVLRDGDFIIQGILPLASETSSCSTIERIGLISMFSLQYAIDQINENNLLLANYSIGYQIDNSCYSIPTVMARGIEIVSQYRPESVCKARTCIEESDKLRPITAVIGTQNSYTSIPLASLFGLYKIPQISPTASSRLLSKKSLYPSFFRTIPSDTHQAMAVSDVLKHFNWNYVYAIGSDDNYGKLGISTMNEYAEEMGFCIVEDDYIPHLIHEMQIKAKKIANRLKEVPNAAVIVIFAYDDQIQVLMKEVQDLGLERTWIMSDAFDLFDTNKAGIKETSLRGILRVSPINRKIPGLKEYVMKKISKEAQCNKFLELYLTQRFDCRINNTAVLCANETLESMASKITSYSNFAFAHIVDALDATAHALQSTLHKMCKDDKETTCPLYKTINPQVLTEELLAVKFKTFYNTTFTFNKDGDPVNSFYYIDNVQKVNGRFKFVSVGQWDPQERLQIREQDIVWPLWARNTRPRSVCSDDCHPGQYVSARTECCWSCQRCPLNQISKGRNMDNCTKCPDGSTANKHATECLKNTLHILTAETAAGISITIINSIGIVLNAAIYIGYHKYLKYHLTIMPHHHYISMVQVTLSFMYGTLLLMDRTEAYCSITGILSSLLLTGFAVLLMAKTHFFIKVVRRVILPVSRISLAWSHCILMMILMLIHIVLLVACLVHDPLDIVEEISTGSREISLTCYGKFSVLQFITLLCYPLLLLVLATILAFRERSDEQNHGEAKYLNFTAIAMCIVVVASMPTFRFVAGIYRSIVLAFTYDVFAFTYIGCLKIPRLYVVFTNKINGVEHSEVIARVDS